MELEPIESFAMFSQARIQEYYTRLVLKEDTPEEKTTAKILQDAAELHEYLRTYGSLKDQNKPLVVSGMRLRYKLRDLYRELHPEDFEGIPPYEDSYDTYIAGLEGPLSEKN